MLVINSETFTLWRDHFARLQEVVSTWELDIDYSWLTACVFFRRVCIPIYSLAFLEDELDEAFWVVSKRWACRLAFLAPSISVAKFHGRPDFIHLFSTGGGARWLLRFSVWLHAVGLHKGETKKRRLSHAFFLGRGARFPSRGLPPRSYSRHIDVARG